jgi:hypothetical protein
MNFVPDKNAGSRSNIGSSREQCPPYITQAPYLVSIDPGFLNKCYIYLPYSKFSAKECHYSLNMMQINLNEFTFLGHLVPMLNVPRFARSTNSLGWFTRLAGPLTSKARQVLLYHSIPAFARFLFCVFSIRVPLVVGK